MLARVLYPDPFSPTLFSSPPLAVTDEQRKYVREVLDIACSDSKFAEKAYNAIIGVLTAGNTPAPVVSSLTPASAVIGDPSFTLHVHGTGFDSGSKIVFGSYEEPTTLVSPTEVTTGVDMSVWLAPDVIPVHVQSSTGVPSASKDFTFTDAGVAGTSKVKAVPEKKFIAEHSHAEKK